MNNNSTYLSQYLYGDKLEEVIKIAEASLKDIDYDTIAIRGVSGLLIGPALAMVTKKNLLVVRKEGESTHSVAAVEGANKDQKIVILDDFISTGETIEEIVGAILKECITPTIQGIYLYKHFKSGIFGSGWLGEIPIIPRVDLIDFLSSLSVK